MIAVRCRRGAADRQGPDITDPIITGSVAVSRGRRYLDDPEQGGYYRTVSYSLGIPYRSHSLRPEAWISVTCEKLGLSGKVLKIRSVRFSGDGAAVSVQVDAEGYYEPV